MMINRVMLLILLFGLELASSCAMKRHVTADTAGPGHKITFDLSSLNAQGLYGPPDGLRSLDYEFCIPARHEYIEKVKRLDPTLRVYLGSKGRIGCSRGEALCIGNTRKPNWREVLLKLADLPFVKRINQAYFE
jgi:hypothetical protein